MRMGTRHVPGNGIYEAFLSERREERSADAVPMQSYLFLADAHLSSNLDVHLLCSDGSQREILEEGTLVRCKRIEPSCTPYTYFV